MSICFALLCQKPEKNEENIDFAPLEKFLRAPMGIPLPLFLVNSMITSKYQSTDCDPEYMFAL